MFFFFAGAVNRDDRAFPRRMRADPMMVFDKEMAAVAQMNREGFVVVDVFPEFVDHRHLGFRLLAVPAQGERAHHFRALLLGGLAPAGCRGALSKFAHRFRALLGSKLAPARCGGALLHLLSGERFFGRWFVHLKSAVTI